MERTKNASAWTEEGYDLFAREGVDGIHIERLARILNLNKSGFYHYFGDQEVFLMELLRLHEKKADNFLSDISSIRTIDPEYFQMVVKHKIAIMFQVQLIRCKGNAAFTAVAEKIDQEENEILRSTWSEYLGYNDRPDLAIRYFNFVRDMFYARMSFRNISYSFLRDRMTEVKILMEQLAHSMVEMEVDGSAY